MPDQPGPSAPRVVLAHDYLVQMGGAERVVAWFHCFWPEAPILTSVVQREGLLAEFAGADIRETWMRHLPGILRDFRRYFAVYPFAFLSQRPIRAEVLLVSASTFAKCLRAARGTRTICYCHAPTRFLWDDSSYLLAGIGSPLLRAAVRCTLPVLRFLDRQAARRIDVMVANSEFVRAKIRRAYGRDAVVIHPPVDVEQSVAVESHLGYYLMVSRLVRYKGVDIAIEACRMAGRRLVIVGEGPDRPRLEALAVGADVVFRGRLGEDDLRACLRACRAFLFPGQEDFGIAPVEAQGWGKPVIALGRGGALETVVDGRTGLFHAEPTAESLCEALHRFEGREWIAEEIRRHALKFGPARFEREIRSLVDRPPA